jgi:hypothetical protein
MTQEDELQCFHAKLKKAFSSLFVKNSTDSQVRIFEVEAASFQRHIREKNESELTRDDDKSHQKKLLKTCISFLIEIHDILKMTKLVSHYMQL